MLSIVEEWYVSERERDRPPCRGRETMGILTDSIPEKVSTSILAVLSMTPYGVPSSGSEKTSGIRFSARSPSVTAFEPPETRTRHATTQQRMTEIFPIIIPPDTNDTRHRRTQAAPRYLCNRMALTTPNKKSRNAKTPGTKNGHNNAVPTSLIPDPQLHSMKKCKVTGKYFNKPKGPRKEKTERSNYVILARQVEH